MKLKSFWGDVEPSPDDMGFSQYAIEVNDPPDVSNAELYVRPVDGNVGDEGVALDTKWVLQLVGVEDVDVPLTYNWYYRPATGNSTGISETCTFPSQGKLQACILLPDIPCG